MISSTQTNKRTDYPGKKISQIVQTQWENNFSNKIEIVVGYGWIYGWYAQNLSYHLESRPKWKMKLEKKPNVGTIWIKRFNEINNWILCKVIKFEALQVDKQYKGPVVIEYNGYEDFHITYGYGSGYLTALSKKAKDFFKKENCRICLSSSLTRAVKLTPTPPGNNFLLKSEIGLQEKEYPLELHFCNNCYHIQLGHVVDSSLLFQNNYSYVSGTSPVFVNHLSKYAEYVIDLFDLEKSSLIVDIGSNDGSLLFQFKKYSKCKVLGIDPSKIPVKIAKANNINSINKFFNFSLSIYII